MKGSDIFQHFTCIVIMWVTFPQKEQSLQKCRSHLIHFDRHWINAYRSYKNGWADSLLAITQNYYREANMVRPSFVSRR